MINSDCEMCDDNNEKTFLPLQLKLEYVHRHVPCHKLVAGTLALRHGHGPGTEEGVGNHPTHVGGDQQHADLETAKTRMADAYGQ